MTAQQPAPATPPTRPIPEPNVPPAGPWTPWPDPHTRPTSPRYTPTAAERTEARRTLARFQGDLDRQANAALAVVLAHVDMLAGHLENHPECGADCDAMAADVRAMAAMRSAFDAAVSQRRGIAVSPVVPSPRRAA